MERSIFRNDNNSHKNIILRIKLNVGIAMALKRNESDSIGSLDYPGSVRWPAELPD